MSRTTARLAVVIGATGGVGAALVSALIAHDAYDRVICLSRGSTPAVDLEKPDSLSGAADWLVNQPGEIRLVIDATGFLHDAKFSPERSLRDLDPAHLHKAFAINAVGPALLMRHILPLLPRKGRAVFATLSARVGSIGDNRLGGWHAYRASKSALNQFVRGAAIELSRKRPEAICVALHPGTVDTRLSAPFSKSGLDVRPAGEAASDILRVIEALSVDQSGGFFDHKGEPVPY
ncbi:SDR family NAD(P)-dependent oxidoreductase [uncultured Maricaulis sp.]|uniref:SDR family NAD(P)-dependent oxidoreductase n=1 Tax=uncultured Maricaulis sp. TaxID=174710 RepID=UPI00262305C0|nr:SDR family NAD(P)-dependent oxidoreductase [uncultured Maricaulis sp.]